MPASQEEAAACKANAVAVEAAGGANTSVVVTEKVQQTPLPMKKMLALVLVLLSEALSTNMLVPFAPFFVAYLQNYAETKEAGRTAGMLVGLFMLGQVASAKLWGYVSDLYGRRFPLLLSVFMGGVTIFFFGMSPNFTVCCILRFIHGFFNGNTLIAKTAISDITDSTNEAKGFSFVSITWGAGSMVGPAIGGLLYNPADNEWLRWMHVTETDFLGRNPAFLPCFVIFVYSMASFAVLLFYLPETNPYCKSIYESKPFRLLARYFPCFAPSRKAEDVTVESEAAAGPPSNGESAIASTPNRSESVDAQKVGVYAQNPSAAVQSTFAALEGKANPNQRVGESQLTATTTTAPLPTAVTGVAAAPGKKTGARRSLTYGQAFQITPVRNVTLFFMVISAAEFTYTQALPLWCEAETSSGGLGLFSATVAVILLVCSVPSVVCNLAFSTIVTEWFKNNYKLFWAVSMAIYSVSTAITPGANWFSTESGQVVYVTFWGVVRQVGQSWGYSLIHMLTAKSAPVGCVGAVYGVSQSCAAAVRCVIPFVIAPLFAWSVAKTRPFPFNYWLTFLFAALCSTVALVLGLYVRITRNADDDAQEATLFAHHHHHGGGAATDVVVDGQQASPAPGVGAVMAVKHSDSEEDAEEEGLQGTYFALVVSFAGNPLPMAEMRRLNEEANAERMRASAPPEQADDVKHSSPTVPAASPLQEDSPVTVEVASPHHPPVSHKHVLRASSHALLASLQTEQVESGRQEEDTTSPLV